MKKQLVIFCLLFSAFHTFANKIDSLTNNSVKQFLSPLIAKFRYPNADKNWEVKSWQKLDLNNDGLTDLIAIEVSIGSSEKFNFVVIDKGNDNFQLINLCYYFASGQESIEPIKTDGLPLIVFHGFRDKIGALHNNEPRTTPRTDTLIYLFDDFIEYNKAPQHLEIDSISYSTSWAWHSRDGTLLRENPNPDQKLVISHNGKAVYTNTRSSVSYIIDPKHPLPHHPKYMRGSFKGTIKKNYLEEIYNLINYIDIKKLQDKYSINFTDYTFYYIHVKFKDGTVKNIADYGGSGTFGLKSLFGKLGALRDSQDWK